MTDLKAHPAAELFPLMEGADFDALVGDIKAHGQRDPIIVHEHLILDGRNRYRACQSLSLTPKLEEWDEDGDPIEYVVSKNLHRRHLNASQRATIAARLATLPRGSNRFTNIDVRIPTTTKAAQILNVSRDIVQQAKLVLKSGTPEEIASVESGEAAVTTVANQIRAGQSPTQRKKSRDEDLSKTGRNPERIQRQQLNAEVWGRVRDALIHLTSLPLVTDVVAIARAHDKTGLVDQRIGQSLEWLKEFQHEWCNRDQAKAEDRPIGNRDADPGVEIDRAMVASVGANGQTQEAPDRH